MTFSNTSMLLLAAALTVSGCKSLPFDKAKIHVAVAMNEAGRPALSTGVSFAIPARKPATASREATAVSPSENGMHPKGASSSYWKLKAPLRHVIEEAIRRSGRRVEIRSDYRHGDPRQHGKGNAIDVQLVGSNGRPLSAHMGGRDWAGTARHFREYEAFAHIVRKVQLELYPGLPLAVGRLLHRRQAQPLLRLRCG